MKYHQPRPLSEFTEECIGPVLSKQGFASTDLVLGWADIVGDKLAESCVPIRIKFPTNRHAGPDDAQEPATLMLREKAVDRVGVIEDSGLREALIRLGAGIIGTAKTG